MNSSSWIPLTSVRLCLFQVSKYSHPVLSCKCLSLLSFQTCCCLVSPAFWWVQEKIMNLWFSCFLCCYFKEEMLFAAPYILSRNSLGFLNLYINVFLHFWKILSHHPSKCFFCFIVSLFFFWVSSYILTVFLLLSPEAVLLGMPPYPFFFGYIHLYCQ